MSEFKKIDPNNQKMPTQKQIEEADLITLAAITTQLSLFYAERVKELGKPFFTKQLKHFGNKYIEELLKIETTVYDKLYDIEEDVISSQTNEVEDGILFLKQCGFVGFVLANKFNRAYNYDSNRVMGIIDKIISDHEK